RSPWAPAGPTSRPSPRSALAVGGQGLSTCASGLTAVAAANDRADAHAHPDRLGGLWGGAPGSLPLGPSRADEPTVAAISSLAGGWGGAPVEGRGG
ncbi:hypothetical protein, partial [Streptomyces sp. NPDC059455]|uniref:hypothetical protein n=1 Tax=Streptomyces sp. NPDC059455 TaxID=3346837 RepID=UPI003675FD3A